MATVVLQAVGSAVGGSLGGPIGAVIGRTLGALGGSYIDQKLFGGSGRTVTGPRLESTQVLSSREGSVIPRVYGRAKITGEVIWATQFEEVQNVTSASQGGKGGPPKTTTVSYSYFANFAIALSEGKIAGVGRIWADGKLLDQTELTIRVHQGDEAQLPDSLIEAKQGVGNAPSYRGIAYIVFEGLPVADYGNRIPQIAVEVIRPIGSLEKHVYGVNLIPGSTEFGYDTQPVVEQSSAVESIKLNVHQTVGETDFLASLDELLSVCPNLKQISLVVVWFGDDLRAGECSIQPAVEVSSRNISRGEDWHVAGLNREDARIVSHRDGSPALGGTPSDQSVLRAIEAIKQRGIKVCLNPFLMMDIPPENNLPSPFGDASQPAYPWRGRITCTPASGILGTVDGTITAANQVASFVGGVTREEITVGSNSVNHSGVTEWSYRRMILHYARLAQLAGGVEMFLIGSEFRGLTSVRSTNDQFPFVDALGNLADDVSTILGTSCLVTYGADWSEYFGFQPADGSQDVFYNLDPLWARISIGAIGVDNYMPISDWRDEGIQYENWRSSTDANMLSAQIAGAEGFDWFYQSYQDRLEGTRTPISDGLNKPWVFRYKDLVSWWSNLHFDRRNGVELAHASDWIPQSKPIIFTEFGCPAIGNGAAQPNLFVDPKSSESGLPYFSNGGRDDYMQAAYIEAFQKHWDHQHPSFNSTNNPVSTIYSGRMVEFDKSTLWAWDARPFPYFPHLSEQWTDADNWGTGHWLNGRLGNVRLADLITDLMHENGLFDFDVSQVTGSIDGYVIADKSTARNALEVLLALYGISVFEDGGIVVFRSPGLDAIAHIEQLQLVDDASNARLSFHREQETDLPVSVHLSHLDPNNDFQEAETSIQRVNRLGLHQEIFSAPLVSAKEQTLPLLQAWLQKRWIARDSVTFGLSNSNANLTAGDEFTFNEDPNLQRWQITQIDYGEGLKVEARAVDRVTSKKVIPQNVPHKTAISNSTAAPHVVFLDLPVLQLGTSENSNRIAVTVKPWVGEQAVYSSPATDGHTFRQSISNSAFTGRLVEPLQPDLTTGRWSFATSLKVTLYNGTLSSAFSVAVLNGANSLCVKSASGSWEVLQFQNAELIDTNTWMVTGLLRGQAGTERESAVGAEIDADVVVLNQAVYPVENSFAQHGLELNWLIGPTGKSLDGLEFTKKTYALGYRGELPFSPVHLKAGLETSGNITASWVRRDRLKSDDWTPVEIPMSEQQEEYLVRVTSGSDSTTSKTVNAPTAIFSAEELESAFGMFPDTFDISVAQVSASVGAGPAAKITLPLP